jgi:Uma2 family endonuclease
MPDLIEPPPELVVEVRRPFDQVVDLLRKMVEYLEANVRVVLLLFPDSRTVGVYHRDRVPETYTENDQLTLPEVLPGFTVRVADFFA